MKIILNNSELVFAQKREAVVVYKNSITTSDAGQYIQITDILGSMPFNRIKVEAIFIPKSTWSLNVLATRGNQGVCNIQSGNLQVRSCGGTYNQVTPSKDTEYSVGFNLSDGTSHIDSQTFGSSGTPSTSTIDYINIFGTGDGGAVKAGESIIKSVQIYDTADNSLLFDLVPALVDDVPCLYDKVNKKVHYEVSGGTLVVE